MTASTYYRAAVLQDNPLAYYPLADLSGSVASDLSGNGYNGTINGGVTLGQAALLASGDPGGKAVSFNGTSGYLSLPNAVRVQPPLAYDAWIAPITSLGSGEGVYILANDPGLRVRVQPDGSIQASVNIAGTWYAVTSATGVVTLGSVHHVGVDCDSSNKLWLYLDGVLIGSATTAAGSIGYSGNPMTAACDFFGGPHNFWQGRLAHLAVYGHTLGLRYQAHYQAGTRSGPYHVMIGGQEQTLVPGSLNVSNQIGQRSTGGVQVQSALGTIWQYGTAIALYNDSGALVYSGYVHKDKATKDPGLNAGQGLLNHNLTLMDNCYKADKRIIYRSYLNTSAGAIAQDLVNRVLYQEGVTYTSQSIGQGVTVPEVIWNGRQISQCLAWLAKNSGYWWNIDINGVLWFLPYGGVPAPLTMDGTQAEANENLYVQYGNDMYVNTQYTIGGNSEKGTKKAPLIQQFHGDGTSRSFTLGYQVSSLYQVLLNGTDVTAQSLTKGNNGGQFYYAPGDATIAQDPSQAVLQSSDTLEVHYAGKLPAIGKAQDAGLVAAQRTREGSGSSGIVESVYRDTKVHTLPAALQIASALLAHYGSDTTILDFDTLTPGFMEGQMLPVDLPDFALTNRQMLISAVGLTDQSDDWNVWYHVTAVGSPLDSAQFQTFWQNLMNQQSDPSDLSDVNDTTITPIATSSFSHSPSFHTSGLQVTSPICGVTSGPHTMVCGQWKCS